MTFLGVIKFNLQKYGYIELNAKYYLMRKSFLLSEKKELNGDYKYWITDKFGNPVLGYPNIHSALVSLE